MNINQEIMDKAKEVFPLVKAVRREIHRHPEVGLEEYNTSRIIKTNLNRMGIPYRDNLAVTGVAGLVQGKNPGKVIGLRADMDALTITEDTGAEYASQIDGLMHACGHDAHVAMLLGAAKILNEFKDRFNGAVKLIFQPAEEGPGGAKPMIEQGVLTEPQVDAVVGFHVSTGKKTGLIGLGSGPTHAAQDQFNITLLGKGGHAAHPEKSIDTVVMAAEFVMGVQKIVSRFIDPLEPAVLTVGTINGGYRQNIIADRVEMKGTIRYLNDEVGDKMRTWIKDIAWGVTQTYGGDFDLEIIRGYPVQVNDHKLAVEVQGYLKELLGDEQVCWVKKPTMGAEDFAYFGEVVPSLFLSLGAGGDNGEFSLPHHHKKFDIDERAMIVGSAAFVKIALEYLKGE